MIKLSSIIKELFATDITHGADKPRWFRSKTVLIKYDNTEKTTDGIICHFTVTHPELHGGTGRNHQVDVNLASLDELLDSTNVVSTEQIKYAMVAGDVKVKCTCEDFLYKGFAYIGTELDYSLQNEPRFPTLRNPTLEGSVCKHSLSVLSKLNLFYSKIVSDIKSIV